MRKYLLPLLLFCSLVSAAQKTSPDSASRLAIVNVTVTNKKAKPLAGEEVIFRGEHSGKILSAISDANGKIKQVLPPGDSYNVSVKSISDTTKYAVLQVPTLEADEYFTEPFWVNIQIEPARSYRLDNVHFDTDKASLRPDSYNQLNELLEYLQRHSTTNIEISGHTDNTGTAAHNLKLSQDRANTIRDFLVKKGIKANRVTAKGYGDSQPVADNATEEGRQLNRRTEVRML